MQEEIRFSILIPTHNRVEYLKHAIASVLGQNHQNAEIIISDNYSSDATSEYCKSLNNANIKYIRTNKIIPDNWENALNQASGEYVTLIGDDDYLMPGYLSAMRELILKEKAKVLYAGNLTYHYENNCYTTPKKYKGTTYKVSSDIFINRYFYLPAEPTDALNPHSSTLCFKKSIADEIRSETGVFYASFCEDVSSLLLLATQEPSFYYIDKPLVIIGNTQKSTCNKALTNKSRDPWSHRGPFQYVPLQGRQIANAHAETLLWLKHNTSRFTNFPFNEEAYLENYCLELFKYHLQTEDFQEKADKLLFLAKTRGPKIQKKLISIIKNETTKNFFAKIKKAFNNKSTKETKLPQSIKNIQDFAWFLNKGEKRLK